MLHVPPTIPTSRAREATVSTLKSVFCLCGVDVLEESSSASFEALYQMENGSGLDVIL